MDAHGWGMIDGLGGSGGADAGLPVRLFNTSFNFAELDARGEAGRTVGESCFALRLKFAGQEIFYRGFNSDCTLGGTPSSSCGDADVDVLDELLMWESDFFVEKSKSAERDFVIALVPITARLEGSGKVGFLTNVSIPICEAGFTTTTFKAEAGPYAELGMQASGGVGTSKGLSGGRRRRGDTPLGHLPGHRAGGPRLPDGSASCRGTAHRGHHQHPEGPVRQYLPVREVPVPQVVQGLGGSRTPAAGRSARAGRGSTISQASRRRMCSSARFRKRPRSAVHEAMDLRWRGIGPDRDDGRAPAALGWRGNAGGHRSTPRDRTGSPGRSRATSSASRPASA